MNPTLAHRPFTPLPPPLLHDAGDTAKSAPGTERTGENVDFGAVERETRTPTDNEAESLSSTMNIASRHGAGAHFCSADACSVRKEATRRAHLQLSSPIPHQLGSLTTLGVDEAATAVQTGGGGKREEGSAIRLDSAGSVTPEAVRLLMRFVNVFGGNVVASGSDHRPSELHQSSEQFADLSIEPL